ncbi:MAG: DNA topoisomerase III [Pseudopedobacter saltans]|uniref:DNA topoisomerase n=1 Tax=Pseudopedobacter saltans TaxID=151895 RepID=A0A2W5FB13_9SPHI|nr:MAG: DNA topoisomerase III [Pseudopedobacter saltans]
MIVCIAEKPSVAKELAEILGAKVRKDGYFEGNGYCVTWTFGHLCTLKEPHDYSEHLKSWSLFDLPIVPPSFGIKLITNKGVEKQFNTIKELMSKCDEVINCGDAGQEGELIQRWVMQKAQNKAPVKRLWISSLTEESIREGFNHLQDASKYDNLYAAGSARAIGDWLLGMNATRLYTKKYAQNKMVLSIGRVQTPTLAMLVQRQKEINAFVQETYWELKTVYKETEFTATINRLKTQEKAEKGLAYLQEYPFEIVAFETKEGREKNPKLYDLTGLQVDANKKYGFSADSTLKLVQSLYEKKLVTYPRVDTTYLSEDLYDKIPDILGKMVFYKKWIDPLLAQPIPKSKYVFDNNKVSDHHAIIPTGEDPSGISNEEKRIYDLIARRFVAVFYPECIVSNTTVLGKVGEVEFKVTGKQIIEPGWRELYPKDSNKESKEKEEEKIIPNFEVGESGPHEPFVHQGKTSAPKPYTEATLLRAMETAGKQVEDEELREVLKENGIGRPSTRANIIETLLKRQYMEKRKKNLFATEMGINLIDTIQNELLKSPELTGNWEHKLHQMERGEYSFPQFKKELIEMVVSLVKEVKNSASKTIVSTVDLPKKEITVEKKTKAEKKEIVSLSCPKCKSHQLIKGKTAYGCADYKNCSFKLPFEIFGKKLTEKQIVDLVSNGATGKIKGLVVDGTKLDGKIVLDDNYGCKVDI